jgi:hypothetical protein
VRESQRGVGRLVPSLTFHLNLENKTQSERGLGPSAQGDSRTFRSYLGVIADLRENQLVDNIPTDDFSRDPLLEKMIGSVVTQEYVIDT